MTAQSFSYLTHEITMITVCRRNRLIAIARTKNLSERLPVGARLKSWDLRRRLFCGKVCREKLGGANDHPILTTRRSLAPLIDEGSITPASFGSVITKVAKQLTDRNDPFVCLTYKRSVRTPRPLLRPGADTRTHGIENNVASKLEHMAVARDKCREESALEQMPATLVAAIEPLRVDPIELSHAAREVRLGRQYNQVVVIAHQAVCNAPPPEPVQDLLQDTQERPAINIIRKDRPPLVTARNYVI
jgi:hypothetical protein